MRLITGSLALANSGLMRRGLLSPIVNGIREAGALVIGLRAALIESLTVRYFPRSRRRRST
ncbi:MAG: hypothetical protein U0231_20365 [Nitrospiraceae bacterium]